MSKRYLKTSRITTVCSYTWRAIAAIRMSVAAAR